MRLIASLAPVVSQYAVAAAAGDLEGLFPGELDHPAIGYETRPARDTVAGLNLEIRHGPAWLKFDGASGYLAIRAPGARCPD
jgi:hypothetical protein